MYSNKGKKLPVMVFTCNRAFDPSIDFSHDKRRRTARHYMKEWGIDPDMVVFMPNSPPSRSKIRRENKEMIRHYLRHFSDQIDANDWILHDKHSQFGKGRLTVFDDEGYHNHRQYPPCVHQYLSVNDNHIHGTVKTAWRRGEFYGKEAVKASLDLKRRLDSVDSKVVVACWENNFSLGNRRRVKRAMRLNIWGRGKNLTDQSDWYLSCRKSYCQRGKGQLTRSVTLRSDPMLSYESTFDGKHWCTYEIK
jgi:hypothetical protein